MPANVFGRSAVAKRKKDVSMFDAANALREYARQGADVDPKSDEHRRAYIALRDTHARCSSEQFAKYLESVKTKVSQGAISRQEYWAVPKVNFPDGLPEHIQEYTIGEDNCEGFIVDLKHYYVIDRYAGGPPALVDSDDELAASGSAALDSTEALVIEAHVQEVEVEVSDVDGKGGAHGKGDGDVKGDGDGDGKGGAHGKGDGDGKGSAEPTASAGSAATNVWQTSLAMIERACHRRRLT